MRTALVRPNQKVAGQPTMSFFFIEHTADMGMECRGASFEELLDSAADGLYALALRRTKRDTGIERAVEIDADGPEEMLVRWLQELIYLLETDHFVAVEREFQTVSERSLAAVLKGHLCGPEDRAVEVKSATYHDLEVRQEAGGYVARVTFDL